MRKIILTSLLMALILPTPLLAIKKKNTRKPKVVKVMEDPKFTAMLSSTAQVIIIDSMVVDSTDYMNAIHVNNEEGRIASYQEFFRERGTGMVYINELGNKCIYSKFDGELGGKYLFQSDLLSDGWTIGEPLKGIDADGQLYDFDFPYLMPDGITLYFSAKGGNSLGGYDIYRTRFDIDEGKFLKPENLGLPYNSAADDYAYVIDEQNKLAYFASNRRQPAGSTCVYTFIPTDVRKMYSNIDEDTIRSRARIDRIADTWTDKTELYAAQQRLSKVANSVSDQQVKSSASTKFEFIVNDRRVYTKLSDFKARDNKKRMQDLLALQQQVATLKISLDKSRDYYATAPIHERAKLKPEIQQSEYQLERLNAQIHTLEKTIRNTENQ